MRQLAHVEVSRAQVFFPSCRVRQNKQKKQKENKTTTPLACLSVCAGQDTPKYWNDTAHPMLVRGSRVDSPAGHERDHANLCCWYGLRYLKLSTDGRRAIALLGTPAAPAGTAVPGGRSLYRAQVGLVIPSPGWTRGGRRQSSRRLAAPETGRGRPPFPEEVEIAS